MGTWVNTGDSQQREKHRPGGLAVAEVSPALAEVAGLAASASAIGDVELVDRLLEGEKGVELLARHVEVEVCSLEEGKGTEYLLHGGAEDMVGAIRIGQRPIFF